MRLLMLNDKSVFESIADDIGNAASQFVIKSQTFFYQGTGYKVIDISGDDIHVMEWNRDDRLQSAMM